MRGAMRGRIALAIAALAGCATYRSSFQRTRNDGSELVWAYHNGFQVTRAGKVLAEQGNWDGLAGAVACVPGARAQADSAASRAHTGKIVSWSGIGVMVAGLVAGTAIAFQDTSDIGQILLGLGVMGGGVLVGVPMAAGGAFMRARADTTAIDAVNLYNDERGACRPE